MKGEPFIVAKVSQNTPANTGTVIYLNLIDQNSHFVRGSVSDNGNDLEKNTEYVSMLKRSPNAYVRAIYAIDLNAIPDLGLRNRRSAKIRGYRNTDARKTHGRRRRNSVTTSLTRKVKAARIPRNMDNSKDLAPR